MACRCEDLKRMRKELRGLVDSDLQQALSSDIEAAEDEDKHYHLNDFMEGLKSFMV